MKKETTRELRLLKAACDRVEDELRRLGVLPSAVVLEAGDEEMVSYRDTNGNERRHYSLFNLIRPEAE